MNTLFNLTAHFAFTKLSHQSFQFYKIPSKENGVQENNSFICKDIWNLPESLGFDVLLFVNNWQLYVFYTDLCDNFDFHLPQKIENLVSTWLNMDVLPKKQILPDIKRLKSFFQMTENDPNNE